ncbi:hypothetical protein VULLAG_LOCUS10814 [Vulpes lagopus]
MDWPGAGVPLAQARWWTWSWGGGLWGVDTGFLPRPEGGPQPAPLDAPLGGLRQGLKLRLMITANLGLPPKKKLIFPATTG